MPTPVLSTATTTWNGQLLTGRGRVSLDSSHAVTLQLSWKARSEGGADTTTPEELLAAAHSGCYSMALANALAAADFTPDHIVTTAEVTFETGRGICRVSLALTGVIISVEAALE